MQYNVLIADDISVNRKVITSILKKNMKNLIFFEAVNGAAAMDILLNNDMDLVILDLLMPEKDGYQVLKEVKSIKGLSEIPIIISSAVDDIDSIKKTLEMGALDYFTFPLKPDEMSVKLPLKVRNALDFYEQRKALIKANEKNSRELLIANSFQKALMSDHKKLGSMEMYGRYIPCSMIGGDLYDCTITNGSFWFIIADVVGHGVAAAMISTMLKGLFNDCVENFSYPGDVLSNINQIFYRIFGEIDDCLISAFAGKIEGNELYYSNAGHPYPVIMNTETGAVKVLAQNGLLLAAQEDVHYKNKCESLKVNDAILLYTDGLFNIRDEEYTDPWNRISRHMLENARIIKETPHGYLQMLVDSFQREYGKEFDDDVSLMFLIKYI